MQRVVGLGTRRADTYEGMQDNFEVDSVRGYTGDPLASREQQSRDLGP
jgi:hypothetical protein